MLHTCMCAIHMWKKGRDLLKPEMFICSLESNSAIVSPWKTEGVSNKPEGQGFQAPLSSVPGHSCFTGDRSALAALKRAGGSGACPWAESALDPLAFLHPFHSGTSPTPILKWENFTISVPPTRCTCDGTRITIMCSASAGPG